jgi:hypothetical protein
MVTIGLGVLAVLATLAAPLLADLIRNWNARITYSCANGLPIKLEGQPGYVAAHELKIYNPSRKKAEDITVYVESSGASLRVEEYWFPLGLEFLPEFDDKGMTFRLPYLKSGENARLKIIVERAYVPRSLKVSFSSPNTLGIKEVDDVYEKKWRALQWFPYPVAVLSIAFSIFMFGKSLSTENIGISQSFQVERRDVLVSAAADAGLPELSRMYCATTDPNYYEAGDIAFVSAAASSKPDEVFRYRKFVSLTLGRAVNMAPESQSSLFYALGKLCVGR